jgi:hypothetical protein
MAGQPLKSGRYLVQQMTSEHSFITTDTLLSSSPNAKFEPVVALPPGVAASVVSFLLALSHTFSRRLTNVSICDPLVGV